MEMSRRNVRSILSQIIRECTGPFFVGFIIGLVARSVIGSIGEIGSGIVLGIGIGITISVVHLIGGLIFGVGAAAGFVIAPFSVATGDAFGWMVFVASIVIGATMKRFIARRIRRRVAAAPSPSS